MDGRMHVMHNLKYQHEEDNHMDFSNNSTSRIGVLYETIWMV